MADSRSPPPLPKHALRQIVPIEAPLSLGSANLDEAISLWFDWREGETGLPDWTRFQPFKNPRMLPLVSVAKREGNDYRCILVGEGVRDFLPLKIEGKLLSEALPSANGDDVRLRLDRSLEDQLPNYVEKTLEWAANHSFISYRSLHMPFGCEGDGHLRVLTMTDFETPITS